MSRSLYLGNLTYAYDQAGRRTQVGGSFARTGLPAAVSSATYDAANELLNWNGLALSHDANGNMLSDGANAFTWDARNQHVALNGRNLQYDANGRRIQNLIGTSFLYDGGNISQELSGSSVTANLLSGGIDEGFSRTDSSGAFTQLKDALGSTIALVDSNGNVQTSYTYDPFGNTSVSGAGNANVYQYTGRENEGNGLYYYRARYYSPTLHRFISEDPLGFRGGDSNLYLYVGDDPENLYDPSSDRAVPDIQNTPGPQLVPNNPQTPNNIQLVVAYCLANPWSCTASGVIGALGGLYLISPGTTGTRCDDELPQNTGCFLGFVRQQVLSGRYTSIITPDRANHILYGDATGGGHRPGLGISGKSELPLWTDNQILHQVSDVATDPASNRIQQGKDWVVTGTRDGIDIRVIIRNGQIWTAYPTNVPRNP